MSESVEVLSAEVLPVVARARAVTVATAQDYQDAGAFLSAIKAQARKVAAYWAPIKAAAHAAWKQTTAAEAAMADPLADAERVVKGAMLKYQAAEEARRLAEEARLRVEAEAKQRAEREAAEAAAREAEARAKAAREAAEAQAKATVAPADEFLAMVAADEAREAAERQRVEAAAAAERARLAAAAPVPVVRVESRAPVVAGQSVRKTWRARVVDSAKVPREFLAVNDAALQAHARATKGQVAVAGVEFFEEPTLAVR